MEITNQIFELLILPCLPALTIFCIMFLKYMTDKLKQKLESDKQREYLDKAYDAISKSVIAMNQTYVQSLKAQGKFDIEAQEKAFNDAKSVALKLMGDEVHQFLQEYVGDVDLWMKVQIETAVNENK